MARTTFHSLPQISFHNRHTTQTHSIFYLTPHLLFHTTITFTVSASPIPICLTPTTGTPRTACHLFRLLFSHSHHMRLHTHGTRPTPHMYAAYILTAPLVTCFIFYFSQPSYAPAYSWHSTSTHLYVACILTAPLITYFLLYFVFRPRHGPQSPCEHTTATSSFVINYIVCHLFVNTNHDHAMGLNPHVIIRL